MDIAEAGEIGSAVGARPVKTARVSFMAASEQFDRNTNGKGLRSESLESASAPGDWRSPMERTMRQQACEVTQLHLPIVRMARKLEAHAAGEEAQWLGMKEWLEDGVTKCDERHRDNILWGMGITDMTSNVLAKVRDGEAAPA